MLFQQQIATIETTATVEVSAAQQATLETTQNILIGGGWWLHFFPKATITLAVGQILLTLTSLAILQKQRPRRGNKRAHKMKR